MVDRDLLNSLIYGCDPTLAGGVTPSASGTAVATPTEASTGGVKALAAAASVAVTSWQAQQLSTKIFKFDKSDKARA